MRELWRRLEMLLRRRRFESELEEEIRAHLERQAEENVAGGMTEREASDAARRQFGNATGLIEESREAWGWRWIEDLAQDLRFTLRSLRRSPAFAAAAGLTLALGIGTNTAIFSVLYGICLAPLPFHEPERLVDVSLLQTTGRRFDGGTSLPNLRDWQSRSHSFAGFGVHRNQFFVNLSGHGEAEEVHSWRLSADALSLLGVPPVLGRWFRPEEDSADGPRSALIAYEFWQSRFGGSRDVLGRRVYIDDEPFAIAGVMPRGFAFPPLIGSWNPVMWLSLNLPANTALARETHSLSVVGRLKPGVSSEQAETEMTGIAASLARAYPKENGEWPAARISRLSDARYITEFRSTMWLLLGAAGLVLLIACVNVASLLLARASARAREFAVRRALGAPRGRLARQLLTESAVLSAFGGALGVLLAYWSLPLMRPLLEGRPRVEEIGLQPAVLAFAAAAAIVTSLVFGLLPALQTSLAETARNSSPRQRLRKTLVTVEIALAVVLVSGAGLLIESFWRATHVDLGFKHEQVLTMRLNLPRKKYATGKKVEAFRTELLRRVTALPGVELAGTNSAPPLGVISQGTDFTIEGGLPPAAEEQFANFGNISPDYLRVLSIPVVRGRHFSPEEATPAILVSESMARKFFSVADPIGRRVRLARVKDAGWFTIIGVVKDVRQNGPESPPGACIYALSSQLPEAAQGDRAGRFIVLSARTALDPAALARAVRAEAAAIDKDQPVADVTPLHSLVTRRLADRRRNTVLAGLFAVLALVLAAIGVFGLVAYSVSRRTGEIGIRMASGARKASILGLIAREILLLSVGGAGVGVVAALATSRLLASLLFEVRPAAPHVLATAAGFLLAASVTAVLLAGRRAMAVDPIIALRHD